MAELTHAAAKRQSHMIAHREVYRRCRIPNANGPAATQALSLRGPFVHSEITHRIPTDVHTNPNLSPSSS